MVCPLAARYRRRVTRAVPIGDGKFIGGKHPVLVQSMCTTETLDTAATVAQCLAMVREGCELLRITAPTPKHAANLKNIREALWAVDCRVPIVADIHFMPDAAMEAALHVEKVRINPGNFADTKRFATKEYNDERSMQTSRVRIEERFHAPGAALQADEAGHAHRHQPRILERPHHEPLWRHRLQGMVESALEFFAHPPSAWTTTTSCCR